MYCKNCKRDVGNMQFCEFCGRETVASNTEVKASEEVAATVSISESINAVQDKIKKLSVKNIIAISFAVILVIAAIVGYSVGNSLYQPEKTAQRYYEYLASGEIESAYKMLDVTNDSFMSEKYYKKYIDSLNLKDKPIVNIKSVNKAINKTLNLFGVDTKNNKTNLDSSNSQTYQIQVDNNLYYITVVQNGKKFGIFNNWHIVTSDFATSWNIIVPKGAKIKVDGLDVLTLGENKDLSSNIFSSAIYAPETQTYVIDSIFPGDYEITGTMEGAEPVKTKGNTKLPQKLAFTTNENSINELKELTKQFLDLYYSNADKSKYDNIVSPESNFIQNFQNSNDSYTLRRLDDLVMNKESCIIDDIDHIKIAATANIYCEQESELFGKETGSVDNTINFSFSKKDGKWIIVDTGFLQ